MLLTLRREIFCDLYHYGGCKWSIATAEHFELGEAVTPDVCKDMKISTRVPEIVRLKFFNYFSKLTPFEIKSIVIWFKTS